MSNSVSSSKQQVFDELLAKIYQTRQQTFAQINTTLIELYWQVGKVISHKVQNEAWGKGIVKELAHYIAHNAPDIKGFFSRSHAPASPAWTQVRGVSRTRQAWECIRNSTNG